MDKKDKKEKKEVIRISVRNLVEFILRSGDLDNRRSVQADRAAMRKGSLIHKKIQKSMGSFYKAEVPLMWQEEFPEFTIQVEGRADGIIDRDEEVTIDEIKGTYKKTSSMEEAIPVHKAQAMCYAYMYVKTKKVKKIYVQLTYCSLESGEIKRFKEEITHKDLETWFQDLINGYYKWAYFQYKRRIERRESMKNMDFPFTYRKGQKNIAAGVYHTIKTGKQLFVQAPTGTGKTMAALFPAIRAAGEGYGDKIFYLTAKTITRTVAEEAFSMLREKGLSYKTLTIIAKEKLCFMGETNCNPEFCPYAKGHFDRVNDAVYELITEQDAYGMEELLCQAEKWKVCPFEMCLDLSDWVDAVICDYNYVFDPNVHLKRFFGENVKGDYTFLIDEAHNLVERGRSMYSAVLCKEDFLQVKKTVGPAYMKLYRGLERCNHVLLTYKRECIQEYEVRAHTEDLILKLLNLMSEMEEFLEKDHENEMQKEVLELSFQVRHFLNMYEIMDDNYVIYTHHGEDGRFYITLYCVNPAENLQACLDKGRGSVFFSATLLPLGYYRSLFSTRQDDYAICADSPFPKENRKILVADDTGTRYTRRGVEEYRKIASYILKTVEAKKGNYMVFFPSYRMLYDVYDCFCTLSGCEQTECLLQKGNMTEKEKEEFLEAFEKEGDKSLVGFCVMGGIFAEGIDLTGEKLIGAIIAGTGIPQIGYEREILKQYYDERNRNGFAYAYRYPGMNKVLQSAGRVIRTREDKGVILLLDERFLQKGYRELFPKEWEDYRICRQNTVSSMLEEFWKETGENQTYS